MPEVCDAVSSANTNKAFSWYPIWALLLNKYVLMINRPVSTSGLAIAPHRSLIVRMVVQEDVDITVKVRVNAPAPWKVIEGWWLSANRRAIIINGSLSAFGTWSKLISRAIEKRWMINIFQLAFDIWTDISGNRVGWLWPLMFPNNTWHFWRLKIDDLANYWTCICIPYGMFIIPPTVADSNLESWNASNDSYCW